MPFDEHEEKDIIGKKTQHKTLEEIHVHRFVNVIVVKELKISHIREVFHNVHQRVTFAAIHSNFNFAIMICLRSDTHTIYTQRRSHTQSVLENPAKGKSYQYPLRSGNIHVE